MATAAKEKWKEKSKKKPKLYCTSKEACHFKTLKKTAIKGEYEVLCIPFKVLTSNGKVLTCIHRTEIPQKVKL